MPVHGYLRQQQEVTRRSVIPNQTSIYLKGVMQTAACDVIEKL